MTASQREINTTWDDQIVAESFDERNLIYKLDRQEYRAKEVLNQKIEHLFAPRSDRRRLDFGQRAKTIPVEYGDHSTARFEVKLFDQFETETLLKERSQSCASYCSKILVSLEARDYAGQVL